MPNERTTLILEKVEAIEKRVKIAETSFDRSNDEIQRLASRSIDLFGGSASSSVADIAAKSKSACDALYAEYQSLVALLDLECRALLDESVSLFALKIIRDKIKSLNEDSKIETNFTASLNQRNLGDVAAVRYLPSLQSLTIQSFWEAKCDMFPNRAALEKEAEAEAEAYYSNKRLTEYREENEKREKEKAKRESYNELRDAWDKEMDENNSRKEKELEKRLSAEKERIIGQIEKEHTEYVNKLKEEIEECEKKKAGLEEELSALGLFDFSKKREIKREIFLLSNSIIGNTQKITQAGSDRHEKIENSEDDIRKAKHRLMMQIAREYPNPIKPINTSNTPSAIREAAEQKYKDAICACLKGKDFLTQDEIQAQAAYCDELSSKDLIKILLHLIVDGRIEKIYENGDIYYLS